jgi:hypothetical protein
VGGEVFELITRFPASKPLRRTWFTRRLSRVCRERDIDGQGGDRVAGSRFGGRFPLRAYHTRAGPLRRRGNAGRRHDGTNHRSRSSFTQVLRDVDVVARSTSRRLSSSWCSMRLLTCGTRCCIGAATGRSDRSTFLSDRLKAVSVLLDLYRSVPAQLRARKLSLLLATTDCIERATPTCPCFNPFEAGATDSHFASFDSKRDPMMKTGGLQVHQPSLGGVAETWSRQDTVPLSRLRGTSVPLDVLPCAIACWTFYCSLASSL